MDNNKILKTAKENRALWFRIVKGFLRIFVRKPKYIYLKEEFTGPCLILSNHCSVHGPLAYELFTDKCIRLWGTYEMNSDLKSVYRYLSNVYFHQKKHINKFLSKIIGFIACPILYIFYRGLRLISTYTDYRFKNTLRESMEALKDDQTLVIFPEDSSEGYFDEIKVFKPGFLALANHAYKTGLDLPIFVAYYNHKTRNLIFDKKVMYSELLSLNLTSEELLDKLRIRCNELGKMNLK